MPPVRWKHIAILLISASIVQQIGAAKSPNIPESYSIIGDGWTPIIGQQHHRGESTSSLANNGEITMYRNPASKTSEPVKAEKLHMNPPKPSAISKTSGNQQQSPPRGDKFPPTGPYYKEQHKEKVVGNTNGKNSSTLGQHLASSKSIIGHGITGGHNVNTITSGGSSLGGKIPPHSKPLLLLPSSHASHGPHIPLNPLPPSHRPPPLPPITKHHQHHQHHHNQQQMPHSHGHHGHHSHHGVPMQPMGPPPMIGQPPKRPHHKPPPQPLPPPPQGPQGNRQVIGAHSTRDEVFVPAPQQIGAYSFFNQHNPNQIKTRITQPHGHIEFTNHFGISPGNADQNLYSLSRQPIQQYIIPKHPVINDVHYAYQGEDFTRNLVPPPAYSNFGHEPHPDKQKTVKPVTEAYIQEKKQQGQFIGNYANAHPEKAVDVQLTKEHLKVYHNNYNVPHGQDYEFGTYQTIKHPSEPPKLATYEVTEGKQWQETQPYYQPFSTRAPHKSRRPQHAQNANHIDVKPFLPTPFKPEYLQPTIASQSEISTIYNQLSVRNKQRDRESNFNPNNPSFFSVKEVSTHFPVVGQPAERPDFITQPPQISYTTDPPSEVTTNQHRFKDFDFVPQSEEESTILPTRQPNYNTKPPVTRKRPQQRRRRPGMRYKYQPNEEADAVTESVEVQKLPESEGSDETTERNRIRRPNRYRTTESPLIEKEDEKMSVIRSRNRYRATKPTSTEQSAVETTTRQQDEVEQERFIPKVPVTEKDFPESFEEQFKANVYRTESYQTTNPPEGVENNRIKSIVNINTEDFRTNVFYNPKPTDLSDVTIYETNKSNQEDHLTNTATEPSYEIRKPVVEEYDLHLYNNDKKESAPHNIMKVDDYQSSSEKSSQIVTTHANVPENEIDYTTILSNSVESATSMDIYKEEYKVPTTTTTTESSIPAVRPSRTRGRPGNRFDTNRPRFSVKDYRQRSTTTTEPAKAANLETSTRIRFPNRSRRPLTTSTTTQKSDFYDETTTERTKVHQEHQYNKHASNKEENESFAEKHFRGNTRRPFGRNRSTTEASTTLKISIKPNIFNNLRRPTPISLRNRILNRQNKTTVATTTTEVFTEPEETNETDLSEIVEATLPYHNSGDSTTEFGAKKTVDIEVATAKEDGTDILKNESFMYSQRVSDLTSSSKNEYNTPGRFKNVPSSSRRVPNYFTLATDEPILPIQAFFPNIKDKS